METSDRVSIVVVGASGDLAQRKILPALFALHCQGLLPADFRVMGFARTEFSDEAFRQSVTRHLTCRYSPGESCAARMAEFLARCHYCAGNYASRESFVDLYARLHSIETAPDTPRIFYLAIPPSVFLDTARAIAGAGLVVCGASHPWSRVVVEKPFGRDRSSSDALAEALAQVFTEEQTYRIDHYLGKEVIQNLMVLRFANAVFEPLWSRAFIRAVHIDWREPVGVGDRGGYFDGYGIVRDVVQNHLTQVLALVAMERPASGRAQDVRDEKVRVLKAIPPLARRDLVIGQYRGALRGGLRFPSYREEKGIPGDSRTPTYAALALRIDNERWRGVPFLITAGKALDAGRSEVRIRFAAADSALFPSARDLPGNEFVIRIQPDEALFLRIVNKEPGLTMALAATDLNLRYESTFRTPIPDAYECLLLDVLHGHKGLFTRSDELAAAWDIFTPVLQALENGREEPEPYEFGSAGPAPALAFAERVLAQSPSGEP